MMNSFCVHGNCRSQDLNGYGLCDDHCGIYLTKEGYHKCLSCQEPVGVELLVMYRGMRSFCGTCISELKAIDTVGDMTPPVYSKFIKKTSVQTIPQSKYFTRLLQAYEKLKPAHGWNGFTLDMFIHRCTVLGYKHMYIHNYNTQEPGTAPNIGMMRVTKDNIGDQLYVYSVRTLAFRNSALLGTL